MTDRGQTIHDYLIGVVIVILTIGVAIGLLGAAYDPFFDPVDTEDRTLADTLADEVVTATQTASGERTVSYAKTSEVLADDFDRLTAQAGFPDWRQANVTVEDATGETVVTAGDAREDEAEAVSIRLVKSVESECAGGCRIIVRVW